MKHPGQGRGSMRRIHDVSPEHFAAALGFTLIELMVAMALTLFIMTILSQAFTLAIDTFSALKGIGDMQVNLGARRPRCVPI